MYKGTDWDESGYGCQIYELEWHTDKTVTGTIRPVVNARGSSYLFKGLNFEEGQLRYQIEDLKGKIVATGEATKSKTSYDDRPALEWTSKEEFSRFALRRYLPRLTPVDLIHGWHDCPIYPGNIYCKVSSKHLAAFRGMLKASDSVKEAWVLEERNDGDIKHIVLKTLMGDPWEIIIQLRKIPYLLYVDMFHGDCGGSVENVIEVPTSMLKSEGRIAGDKVKTCLLKGAEQLARTATADIWLPKLKNFKFNTFSGEFTIEGTMKTLAGNDALGLCIVDYIFIVFRYEDTPEGFTTIALVSAAGKWADRPLIGKKFPASGWFRSEMNYEANNYASSILAKSIGEALTCSVKYGLDSPFANIDLETQN